MVLLVWAQGFRWSSVLIRYVSIFLTYFRHNLGTKPEDMARISRILPEQL